MPANDDVRAAPDSPDATQYAGEATAPMRTPVRTDSPGTPPPSRQALTALERRRAVREDLVAHPVPHPDLSIVAGPPDSVEFPAIQPTISVVIPAMNEELNLPHVLARLPAEVSEVIIVDGHSSDATVAVGLACRPDAKIVTQDGKGKGDALACGFRAVTSEVTVMLDADGSTDPAEIPRFVSALTNGYDFAKGTRFVTGGGSADITTFRRAGNWALTSMVNRIWRVGFSDLCYGYNAFWTDSVSAGFAHCDGFEVETLINIRVAASSLRVVEVPSYESNRRHGESNLKVGRDGTRVMRTILAEWMRPS